MLLPVEGTLEAAKIEVDPHEGMIPDALAFWVDPSRCQVPARGATARGATAPWGHLPPLVQRQEVPTRSARAFVNCTLFLQMDALDKDRPWTLRLPDSPFGEKA